MKAGIPVILGYIPVGIGFAIMARQAGFTVLQTCLMSLSVFAGASQFMSVGMVAQGAAVATIILATFILNLRHIIMSTCVFDIMVPKKTKLKPIAAFGVTDESFAIFTTGQNPSNSIVFFIGLILVCYSSWNVGTLIGAVASDFLPPIITASLGVSLYAMFIGLLVPNLPGNFKLIILVIITGLVNWGLSQFMASSWALIAATLICAFIGVFFVDLDGDKKEDAGK